MLTLFLSVLGILFLVYLLRGVAWLFSGLFFALNRVQWFVFNPIRILFANVDNGFGHALFRLLLVSLIAPVWWLLAYLLTYPLRLATAVYFDIILYGVVSSHDALQELFNPKMRRYRHHEGIVYGFFWLVGFPVRLVQFIGKASLNVLDAVLMFDISLAIPTLTMYHGTRFVGAGVDITQKGTWLVGSGDFVGSGIYFGISDKTAKVYARRHSDMSLVLVRFTPAFTRPAGSLPRKDRVLVGTNGEELSRRLHRPWAVIEHYRPGRDWWEYCLVQPDKAGQFVRSWRVRPIAVEKPDGLERVWGGYYNICKMPAVWEVAVPAWIFNIFAFPALSALTEFVYGFSLMGILD